MVVAARRRRWRMTDLLDLALHHCCRRYRSLLGAFLRLQRRLLVPRCLYLRQEMRSPLSWRSAPWRVQFPSLLGSAVPVSVLVRRRKH